MSHINKRKKSTCFQHALTIRKYSSENNNFVLESIRHSKIYVNKDLTSREVDMQVETPQAVLQAA